MQPKPNDLIRVEDTLDPLRRSFAAKVVGLDTSIGQVLDVLDHLGIADQTLVIFMTDHGGDPKYGGSNLPFRGQKATLYEGGIRVPCLVRWPGKIKAGRVTDQVAWAIDWNATLMDLCDGVSDPMSDGKSILPVLFGESLSEEEAGRTLIWKTGAHQQLGRQSWAAVRNGDWKWVRPPEQSAAAL